MKIQIQLFLFIFMIFICCDIKIAGTLGGGKIYRYNCSEDKLNKYLDSIEKDSSLMIPLRLKKYDNWDERGYNFLKGKLFFIKDKNTTNDEIYYVTVIPSLIKNSNKPGVAIRSIFNTKEYLLGWRTFKEFKEYEKERIEENFKNKVLSKLPLKIISVEEN